MMNVRHLNTLKTKVAQSILNYCDDKPFLALDLDYTINEQIWKANVFEDTAPPYVSPTEFGVNIPPFIRCRQKKNTVSECLELFADVREILEWCALQKIKITICSRSPDRNLVESVLKAFNLWNLFEHPQIFDATKDRHFSILHKCHGVQYRSLLFFDDIQSNIVTASALGIASYLVDRREGLTWSIFLKGMTQYFARIKSRTSLRNWLSPPLHSESRSSNGCILSSSSGDDIGDRDCTDAPQLLKKRKLDAQGPAEHRNTSAIS
eukprot:gene22229-30470_t